jgi:hypothetical protein
VLILGEDVYGRRDKGRRGIFYFCRYILSL